MEKFEVLIKKLVTSFSDGTEGARKRKAIAMTLAVLVVFVTTYMLVLPAFTLDKDEAAEQGGIDINQTSQEEVVEDVDAPAGASKEEKVPDKVDEDTSGGDEDSTAESGDTSSDQAGQAEDQATETSDTVDEEGKSESLEGLVYEGEGYTITVEDRNKTLPADTVLEVKEIDKKADKKEYDALADDALKAVKDEKGGENIDSITFAHFYDISFTSGGKTVVPDESVIVKIEYESDLQKVNKVEDKDDVKVIHFAENEKTGEIEPEVLDSKDVDVTVKKAKVTETSFEAENFSVYGVIGTKEIETTYLTADGKTLNVRVTFDPREELPENAVLEVSEVTYEDDKDAYAKRNERLSEALFEEYGNVAITDVRYLDISIMVPDGSDQGKKEYEPSYPVDIKVNYTEPMDTSNPGEYKDYNDGSTKVDPDIGHHIVGVHYTEDGAEILKTVDENTSAGVSETVTHTDGFSEYDFAYIYEYEIIDTDKNYEPSPISKMDINPPAGVKAAPGGGGLRSAGQTPAHEKNLFDNHDGTHKLSLTVTGDADTDSNTASNANVIIVFDTSNSMVNYYVPMTYGGRGSDNADGSNSYVLYQDYSGTQVQDGYTGTVYRRQNGYYSVYTGQRYSRTIRRADAAEKVLYDFTHALFGYQNEDDPSTPEDESKNIQVSLITFNMNASTVQNWTSTETDITNRVSSTGAGGSKKLGNSSGTNWEAALRAADTMVDSADADPTFVIFITDGQPTQWVGHTSGYDTTGEGYVQSRDEARAVKLACNATGTDSHGELFSIYAYGTEADYLDDLMYYANTGTARDASAETDPVDGYYNASDSAALTEAINDIFSKIVKTLGITSVSVHDGTTSKVQATTGEISHMLEVDEDSYEYWLSFNTVDGKFTMKDLVSGSDVEYTVTSSGGNVTISWTKDGTNNSVTYEGTYSAGTARIKWDRATPFYNYAPPAATFTDPSVDWNLSSVGTLLDGVTYEVTFDVFPSQYTLDLIADLKNGKVQYGDLDSNIRQYLVKKGDGETANYTLKTNTDASISYTDTRTDAGQQTSRYVNPDPVATSAADTLSITKDWSNDVDGRNKPDELLMHVTRDNTDRYELVLNDADHWQDSAYISFGIVTVHDGVIKVKTPGHDFSFSEPPEMEYYWELEAPIIRPMWINGVETMLVKVDASEAPSGMDGANATAVGADGYTYYKLTIGGTAMYYRVDNSIASLHAENHRRSYLQIVKTVDVPKAGDTFDFTVRVKNANDESETSHQDDINSDYYVWFSVYDTVGGSTVISDNLATGEGLQREIDSDTGDYTGYYYIPSGNTVTIKMQHGYSLRFLNLPTGSTYSVSESLNGDYELESITGVRQYKEEVEGEDGTTSVVDKSDPAGTVAGLGISGTIEYADSRYEIDYSNKRVVTEVEAKKEWKNADGTTTAPQGGKVTYTLYADGEPTNYTVELDGTADQEPTGIGGYESVGWTAKFVNLSKYKIVNGEKVEIEYTIAETKPYPGYTPSTTDPVENGGKITNTQESTSANALKAWKNADGSTTAPQGGQVTYTLYADGTPTSYTVTLNGTADQAPTGTAGYESEAWKATFQNLPKYKVVNNTAVEIEYKIAETTTYPGYTASTTDPVASGQTITNTQGSKEIYAVKAWKNADGSTTPPDNATVVFTLYEEGRPTGYSVTLDGTADTMPSTTGGYESEAWKATFVKLPMYRLENGQAVEINYTIAETTTYPGYTASTTSAVASGSTITNTQDPTTANALKAWVNADGSTTAPQGGQVTYTLYADGTATPYAVTLDGTAETAPEVTGGYESEAWKATFVNLPKYKLVDGEAVEIRYTIAETTTYPGYTASTTDPVASGATITNTQEPTSADASKAWKNADGSTEPPAGAKVEFTLYADGAATDYKVELDGTVDDPVPTGTAGYESEAWKATFQNLPKYKVVEDDGVDVAVEIVYTIGESTTYPGYTPSENPVASGGTITNSQDTTEAKAVKAWKNADGSTTPPSGAKVEFTLYADGAATDYKVELDGTADETAPTVPGGYESPAWTASFINLPKYKADGTTEIVYTIAETKGYPGYKASTTDPVASGGTITNSQLSAEIKLLKIGDGDTSTTLAGAEFELYSTWIGPGSSGNVKAKDINGQEIGTIRTTDGGLATIGKLVTGTYYLVETKAPDGYDTLTDPVKIYIQPSDQEPGYTVSYEQKDYSASSQAGNLSPGQDGAYLITVSDPSGTALPNTGGSGTLPYTLGGMMLIITSALMYGFRLRRRERRSR